MRMSLQRIAERTDARRRCVGYPDACRGEAWPRRIKLDLGRQTVGDGNRFAFIIIDRDDTPDRFQNIAHEAPHGAQTFGSCSKVAPIMTNAIRLPLFRLVQPCQLPSCTTTSPAFIVTSPRSSRSVRSPSSRMP